MESKHPDKTLHLKPLPRRPYESCHAHKLDYSQLWFDWNNYIDELYEYADLQAIHAWSSRLRAFTEFALNHWFNILRHKGRPPGSKIGHCYVDVTANNKELLLDALSTKPAIHLLCRMFISIYPFINGAVHLWQDTKMGGPFLFTAWDAKMLNPSLIVVRMWRGAPWYM